VAKTLPAKNGQCGRDAVQQTFDVDVDHRFPVFHAQLVELRDGADAGVVDQDVELAMPVAGQGRERGDVLSLGHVCASVTRNTTGTLNIAHHGF
jgi:hypothetical protein